MTWVIRVKQIAFIQVRWVSKSNRKYVDFQVFKEKMVSMKASRTEHVSEYSNEEDSWFLNSKAVLECIKLGDFVLKRKKNAKGSQAWD